ncbi:MAG TPA: hypothetical protein VJC21_00395 [Candidatus Nanoarchaeia archaeon]|nr:hypothetical protein [Candidatus Nanoarchaeia archaeon]
METIVKTKEWGNSLGLVIPRNLVHELDLVPGEEVEIDIAKKHNALKELWGAIPLKRKTAEILKDVREDLEGAFL